MTRTTLILSAAAMSSVLLCLCVYSQEPVGPTELRAQEARLQLVEAEFDVKMRELELKMSELAMDEATIELDKIGLHLEAARKAGDSHEVRRAELELKQAAIRVAMRKLQSDKARLQIERARAGMEHMRATLTEQPGKPSRVQLEYLDDSEVVVIRGAKVNVERLRALFEGAEKEKKARE